MGCQCNRQSRGRDYRLRQEGKAKERQWSYRSYFVLAAFCKIGGGYPVWLWLATAKVSALPSVNRRFTKVETENGEGLLAFGPAMQQQNVLLLKGDRLEMVFAKRRQGERGPAKPDQLG
jgi:hypothetical protein